MQIELPYQDFSNRLGFCKCFADTKNKNVAFTEDQLKMDASPYDVIGFLAKGLCQMYSFKNDVIRFFFEKDCFNGQYSDMKLIVFQ